MREGYEQTWAYVELERTRNKFEAYNLEKYRDLGSCKRGTHKSYLIDLIYLWSKLYFSFKLDEAILIVILQASVVALDNPPKVEGTVLLKTPCILQTGPRGPWARTDLNDPSLRSSYDDTKWCCACFQRRRQPTILPTYDAYKPHQGPVWHDNPKCDILANILYQ